MGVIIVSYIFQDDIDKPGLLEPVPDIDYYKIAVLPPSKVWLYNLKYFIQTSISAFVFTMLFRSFQKLIFCTLHFDKDDEGKLALWETEPDIDYYKIAVLPPSKVYQFTILNFSIQFIVAVMFACTVYSVCEHVHFKN